MRAPPALLLIEGDADLREAITDLLAVDDAKFRIEVASNYEDGIVLLNASQPALLIAEVLLPGGGDGRKLADAARRLDVPTLLMSGRPKVIEEQQARGIPFLAKPFRLPELRRAIQTLIEGKHLSFRIPASRNFEHNERNDMFGLCQNRAALLPRK